MITNKPVSKQTQITDQQSTCIAWLGSARFHIIHLLPYFSKPILPTHTQLISIHDSERDPQGSESQLNNVDVGRAMKCLTRAIKTMMNLTWFHWDVPRKQPPYEALLYLSDNNSILEDLLLKISDIENPEASIYTTVFYLHNFMRHQTNPIFDTGVSLS